MNKAKEKSRSEKIGRCEWLVYDKELSNKELMHETFVELRCALADIVVAIFILSAIAGFFLTLALIYL